jgi:hypothetical protein
MTTPSNKTGAPKCPKDSELYHLIDYFHGRIGSEGPEHSSLKNELATINALRYLLGLLQYRRAAHMKQQIKRRILVKAARELGLDNEIDAAVELAMRKVMDRQALEDPDIDVDVGGEEELEREEETQ